MVEMESERKSTILAAISAATLLDQGGDIWPIIRVMKDYCRKTFYSDLSEGLLGHTSSLEKKEESLYSCAVGRGRDLFLLFDEEKCYFWLRRGELLEGELGGEVRKRYFQTFGVSQSPTNNTMDFGEERGSFFSPSWPFLVQKLEGGLFTTCLRECAIWTGFQFGSIRMYLLLRLIELKNRGFSAASLWHWFSGTMLRRRKIGFLLQVENGKGRWRSPQLFN